jgi:hypothetical protein
MLVYHPAFDIYHGVCRFLKLLKLSSEQPLSVEHIKLLDYFVVFPSEMTKMRLPLEYKDYRKKFKVNKYESVYNGKLVFQQLQGYQDSALECLAAYAFIDPVLYRKGEVQLAATQNKEELNTLLAAYSTNTTLTEFLLNVLLKMPFDGPVGLKERSNLY